MSDKERIASLEADMKTLKDELPAMETRMNTSLTEGLKTVREMFKTGITVATLVIIAVSLVISLVRFPH